jgi:hypothetical protein
MNRAECAETFVLFYSTIEISVVTAERLLGVEKLTAIWEGISPEAIYLKYSKISVLSSKFCWVQHHKSAVTKLVNTIQGAGGSVGWVRTALGARLSGVQIAVFRRDLLSSETSWLALLLPPCLPASKLMCPGVKAAEACSYAFVFI